MHTSEFMRHACLRISRLAPREIAILKASGLPAGFGSRSLFLRVVSGGPICASERSTVARVASSSSSASLSSLPSSSVIFDAFVANPGLRFRFVFILARMFVAILCNMLMPVV